MSFTLSLLNGESVWICEDRDSECLKLYMDWKVEGDSGDRSGGDLVVDFF